MSRISFIIAAVLLPAAVLAQTPAAPDAAAPARAFASPDVAASIPSGGASGLGQVTLALLVVLAAVFVVAWLIRRLRGFTSSGNQAIEIISQVALGARERAVLIKVGETRLLLGVTPGQVNALHVLPHDAVLPTIAPTGGAGPAQGPQRPSFRSLLMKSLGK